MLKEEIIGIVRDALNELSKNDSKAIKRGVREEAINHRFAVYFERLFEKRFKNLEDVYNFDVEYDKNYEHPKFYINPKNEKVIFRPDFIVHVRDRNCRNLVAFEFKKGYPTPKDRNTLIGLLKPPYSYDFCFHVSYLPDKKYYKIYQFVLGEKKPDAFFHKKITIA